MQNLLLYIFGIMYFSIKRLVLEESEKKVKNVDKVEDLLGNQVKLKLSMTEIYFSSFQSSANFWKTFPFLDLICST